jgi:MoxR-like ATPase
MTEDEANALSDEFRETFSRLLTGMQEFLVGQEGVLRDTLVAFFAGGHVLLEGVPGLGKTLLAKTLASVTGLDFSRIQFTPDLMPADIVGTNLITEDEDGKRRFVFQKGPVFSNLVLADEINRATPKTQSALLEAMQEKAVTVAGAHHVLPSPFLVFATQNPIEMEGTYPLPEAQVDRFFFKLEVPFPSEVEMRKILHRTTSGQEPSSPAQVPSVTQLLRLQSFCRQVPVPENVEQRVARLILATHPRNSSAPSEVKKFVHYGSSPRGGQALLLGAKILALLDRRFHVSMEDVLQLVEPALRHRILLNFEGEAEGASKEEILRAVLRENG